MIKNLHTLLHLDDPADQADCSPVTAGEPLKKKLMKDLSLLILCSYILLIFNPVMPILADAVAHTFWEKEHLLTVHEVNGQYHVHYELINNAKQADKDKSGKNAKADSEDFVHLFSVTVYHFANNYFVKRRYPAFTFYCPASPLKDNFRPPKA